jgi:hypothetical protein
MSNYLLQKTGVSVGDGTLGAAFRFLRSKRQRSVSHRFGMKVGLFTSQSKKDRDDKDPKLCVVIPAGYLLLLERAPPWLERSLVVPSVHLLE